MEFKASVTYCRRDMMSRVSLVHVESGLKMEQLIRYNEIIGTERCPKTGGYHSVIHDYALFERVVLQPMKVDIMVSLADEAKLSLTMHTCY